MTARSMKVRSLILAATAVASASFVVASPLTRPPVPPSQPDVTIAASPLTRPPVPPSQPDVTIAASPLTRPPVPPSQPDVTA